MMERNVLIEIIQQAQKGNMAVQYGDIADNLIANNLAVRKRGHWILVHEHMWQMFDGEIDITAYCEGYHNGPVCEICGAHPCIHCHPDWETSKCYYVSYRCSECNAHKKDKTNFCPDCGTDMEITIQN